MVKTERIIFERKEYIKDSNRPKNSEDTHYAKDGAPIENPRHSDFIYGTEEIGINQLQNN